MKLMKWGAIVLALLAAAQISLASETVSIAVGEWIPYQSREMRHYGVLNHVIDRAFALQGVEVVFEFFPWKRSYIMAKRGDFDATGPWGPSRERKNHFYYSDPLVEGPLVFFHRKSDDFQWKTVEDLEGLIIGGTLGNKYGKGFQEAERTGTIEVYRVPSEEQNFKKLMAGRIDIFPMNLEAGYCLMHQICDPEKVELITHNPRPIRNSVYYLLFSKKAGQGRKRVAQFNRGLRRLKKSGEFAAFFFKSRKGGYLIKE